MTLLGLVANGVTRLLSAIKRSLPVILFVTLLYADSIDASQDCALGSLILCTLEIEL
jgi:hypothetical protein